MTDYFTTKELADYLRIKQRKVYDLAASGKIPCSKAFGKLLFPRDEIDAWIAREKTGPHQSALNRPRPHVFLGSYDPLLEWALRESQSGLATHFDSSADGLHRYIEGEGVASGSHLYDPEKKDWNTPDRLSDCATLPVVVIEWAKRQRGLIVAQSHANKIHSVRDLKGHKYISRQLGSGTEHLFRHLLKKEGLEVTDINVAAEVRSEVDAALAVLENKGDACFGLQSLADQYRLSFVPLVEERFDLIIDRRSYFEPPIQDLMTFCKSKSFQKRAAELAGYDISGQGTVHYNGPQ